MSHMPRFRWIPSMLVAGCLLVTLPWPARGAFSGRNGLLAYSRQVHGVDHLFVIQPKGTARRQLTAGRTSDTDAAWSPDGSLIAFTRRYPGTGHRAIFVIDASGAALRRITPRSLEAAQPAWAPGGKRLAFACSRNLPRSAICVSRLDGTGLQVLTGSANRNVKPAWSPDGSTIAYSHRDATQRFQVWVMNVNGSNKRQVTHTKASELVADWSPDGSRILMTCAIPRNGYEPDLFAVRPDGSNMQRLTHDAYTTAAAWSPSGGRIAIVRKHHLAMMTASGDAFWQVQGAGTNVLDVDWQRRP